VEETHDSSSEHSSEVPLSGPPHVAPAEQRTNTLSIVALVGAFFVGILGVIAGAIALGQIKRTGEQGRGLAIAGIVVGALNILVVLVAVALVLVGALAAASAAASGENMHATDERCKAIQEVLAGDSGDEALAALKSLAAMGGENQKVYAEMARLAEEGQPDMSASEQQQLSAELGAALQKDAAACQ
jgi:hypothetical protein